MWSASAERSWGKDAGSRDVEAVFGPARRSPSVSRGPTRVRRCSVVERYVLRGVVFGRRTQAVSHGDVTRSRVGASLVLFGALEGAGSSRSSSSELGRRSEVVNRFHGGVDASPCRLVDELFWSSDANQRLGVEFFGARRWVGSARRFHGSSGQVRPYPTALRSQRVGQRLVAASIRASKRLEDPPPCPSGRGGRSAKRDEVRGS